VTKTINSKMDFDKCPKPPAVTFDINRKRWRLRAWRFERVSDKRAKRIVSAYYDSEEV
jgi:hypothetical protein